MATTAEVRVERSASLEEIHVSGNVRALDSEHVRALAGSIGLQGMLVPVVVRPAEGDVVQGGWRYELVAGFHRVAAAAELGLSEVPVVVRESGSDAAAATENIARKQLNPQEPGGIALSASFGRSDDAIPSGFGAFAA